MELNEKIGQRKKSFQKNLENENNKNKKTKKN